jgi:hypothetical protein
LPFFSWVPLDASLVTSFPSLFFLSFFTPERERERERASERVSDNGRKRKGRREDNRRSGVGGTWSESWPLLAGTGF